MNCMKCGKETAGEQVFCQDCLAVMAEYPVKPGTPIHIPSQPHHSPLRKAARKGRSQEPEEVIRRQKFVIRWLAALAAVLMVAWGVTMAIVVHIILEQNETPIGQNYSVSSTADGTGDNGR